MSFRPLLPALLITARHATVPTVHYNAPSPASAVTPTTTAQPSGDPAPDDSNPFASSYYHHPPPEPSASYHWTNNTSSTLTALLRTAVLLVVHGLCSLHQRLATTLHIHNAASLQALVCGRPHNTALLTLSNHTSTLDDPYILTALLPLRDQLGAAGRHSWCAADVCFSRGDAVGAVFRLGRVFPVWRGGGLHQLGMDEALSYMAEGGWVHIFPEGKCHPGKAIQPFRWGAAALLVASLAHTAQPALVVPIVHAGMERVLPLHSWLPRAGCDVWVEVGDAVDVSGVVARWRAAERAVLQAGVGAWGDPWPRREEELYVAVNGVLEAAMRRTERRLYARMAAAAARQGGGAIHIAR